MMDKPNYINTGEIGSFAYFTVIRRLPAIVRSMIDNNSFDNETKNELEDLYAGFPDGELIPLSGSGGVSRRINAEIAAQKIRWNTASFIFAENYLYHRLKEICNYDVNHFDYFAYKKENDVLSKKELLLKIVEESEKLFSGDFGNSLRRILHSSLFGNTADLSQVYTVNENSVNLLIDDVDKAAGILEAAGQIDIVLDNSGEELFYDILLSHWLLCKTGIRKINLHFKPFPYFVSDAMIKDFHFLLEALSTNSLGREWKETINGYVSEGKLVLHEDSYWTDTNDYLEIPENISRIFSNSDLVIFKGDLNYRKLVEDRHWNYDTATREIIAFMQKRSLLIRVLKSELITNLDAVPDTENREWMYNGKYGIIQLVKRD